MYQYAKTGGFLYGAHLRHELTNRLGVQWREINNGIADLVGIDQAVLDHFSDRSREIREHLDKIGFRSSRAAQLATLETRTAKDKTIDAASMRVLWEAKAAEIGIDPATLADVVGLVDGHVLTGENAPHCSSTSSVPRGSPPSRRRSTCETCCEASPRICPRAPPSMRSRRSPSTSSSGPKLSASSSPTRR